MCDSGQAPISNTATKQPEGTTHCLARFRPLKNTLQSCLGLPQLACKMPTLLTGMTAQMKYGALETFNA
jgi:hypothetical protein